MVDRLHWYIYKFVEALDRFKFMYNYKQKLSKGFSMWFYIKTCFYQRFYKQLIWVKYQRSVYDIRIQSYKFRKGDEGSVPLKIILFFPFFNLFEIHLNNINILNTLNGLDGCWEVTVNEGICDCPIPVTVLQNFPTCEECLPIVAYKLIVIIIFTT